MSGPVTRLRIDLGRDTPVGAPQPAGRVPRVARLLSLAHDIDRKIAAGEIRDWAEAARRLRLTRARMTQIANLLLLAPEIQDNVLALPPVVEGRDRVTERHLRPIAAEVNWNEQINAWRRIHG